MKKLLFFSLLLLFSCKNMDVVGQNSAKRSLAGFDEVSISGGFQKVILRHGDSESVDIQADNSVLDKIITEVRGNELHIYTKNGFTWEGFNNVIITVTYRQLNEVNNSGSTDVETQGMLRSEKFEFNASGSGDFKGELEVKKLEVSISGSADVKLMGNADSQKYAISGSGDVDASNLRGQDAEVAVSGSGNVKLNVNGRVRSSVSGSGNVVNQN